jgi:hypothetical protein
MKVKITLKFRGREMAHQEFGFQVVEKFTKEIAIYGHPDAEPKLVGRGLTVMLSPLPRSKRPKHPAEAGSEDKTVRLPTLTYEDLRKVDAIEPSPAATNPAVMPPPAMNGRSTGFANNPFAQLDLNAAP